MANKEVVKYVSYGLLSKVDNYALQRMMQLVENSRMKEEDFYEVELRACPHEDKQLIFIKDIQDKECDNEVCTWCSHPVDEQVISYKFADASGNLVQIFCLESEALELAEGNK